MDSTTYGEKIINVTKSLLCRICLKKGTIPLFGDENHKDHSYDLNNLTGMNVFNNDKLPRYLCSFCCNLLESALLLQILVKETNDTLSQCTKLNINSNVFVYLRDLNKNKKVLEVPNETDNYKTVQENNNEETFPINKNSHILDEEINKTSNQNAEAKCPKSLVKIIKPKEVFIKAPKEFLYDAEKTHTYSEEKSNIDKSLFLYNSKSNINIISNEEIKKEYKSDEITQAQSLESTFETTQIMDYDSFKDPIKNNINATISVPNENIYKSESHGITFNTQCKVENRSHKRPLIIIKNDSQMVVQQPVINVIENKHIKWPKFLHEQESKGADNESLKTEVVYELQTEPIKEETQVTKLEEIKCPICFIPCDPKVLKQHLFSHPGPLDEKLKCTVCGKLCTKAYFVSHSWYHFTDSVCDYCGKVFFTNIGLKRHIIKHIPVFSYKCSESPSRAKDSTRLKSHSTINTKIKQIMCSECGKILSSERSYKKHLLLHQKKQKRDFVCDTCKLSFKTKSLLASHIKSVHSGVLEYNCAYCNAPFTTKKYLKRHERDVHKKSHKLPCGPQYQQVVKIEGPSEGLEDKE